MGSKAGKLEDSGGLETNGAPSLEPWEGHDYIEYEGMVGPVLMQESSSIPGAIAAHPTGRSYYTATGALKNYEDGTYYSLHSQRIVLSDSIA